MLSEKSQDLLIQMVITLAEKTHRRIILGSYAPVVHTRVDTFEGSLAPVPSTKIETKAVGFEKGV
ncbi:unnamed protein product [marine sediment metagenome]|uniref:Uncharacterized protein n=1 Tax=marine sediment metagenome TaxID=412755 RepID=X1L2B7_9ZZZZ